MSSSSEADEEKPITEDRIREAIEALLPKVDLATTGVKKFRKLLSKKKFGGADLSEFNDFIKKALTEAINNQASEEEAEEESESEEEEAKPKKSKGGYQKPCELSTKLAKFLGEKELSRPQIVKQMWVYIKEHDLQNPDNRREIMLDDKMRRVFGCDSFTMFSMNKYISHHVHPFPPLDLTSKPKSPSKKRAAPKSKDGSAAKKKKGGNQPPFRLSEKLIAVVGVDILPRPQVVSKLWEYIRAHDLQNPDNRKEILCDDKLSAVLGGNKKVTMFSMNKYISPHLIEKVDRSEYQADGDSDNSD